jgi:DNA mismatch repair protein MutS2
VSLLASAEGRRAAGLLEFPELLDDVATSAALSRSAAAVRELEPTADLDELDALWSWIDELHRFLERGLDLPLADMVDLESLLGAERTARGPLAPEELAAVGAAAITIAQVLDAAQEHRERIPRTALHLAELTDPRPLGEHLQAALEPDGRVKDTASPALGSLRRAIAVAEQRVRDAARAAMAKAVDKAWTEGGELVLRGERYCVPLKAGRRKQMPGIVHDRSDTGHTLFVEPLAVVEAGNDLQEAQMRAAEEERRILAALGHLVAGRAAELADAFGRLVTLDAVRARVKWGRAHRGQRPLLSRPGSGTLRLQGFRHPLLEVSLRRSGAHEQLVPLDLELGDDHRVLLISGPNAGGKTVALKGVGLAVLMAQSGVPLPADARPELAVFDGVFVDVGDDQSIADALSSFSAHMTHVREILRAATAASLVLLDEVGGGTDPVEGVALARAVLEFLASTGVRCVCTTHYGQLKALAHDREGFRNASMAYDQERLEPQFALVLDQPGSSHALEIAGRLQLPAPVLERARSLVGDEAIQLDNVLRAMESARLRLSQTLAEAQTSRDQARASQQRYEVLARELKQKRKESLAAAKREAEGIVKNARAKIERLLAEIRSRGGGDQAVDAAATARAEVDALGDRLQEPAPAPRRRRTRLEPGAEVRHVGLNQPARVVEVRGERVTLDLAGRRLVAKAAELADLDAPLPSPWPPAEGTVNVETVESKAAPASRVDVRGQDADDAWRTVDKALDRCVLSGLTVLEIVHGKGTGTLRRVISQRLQRDGRVRTHSVGGEGQFDDGVTVVEL